MDKMKQNYYGSLCTELYELLHKEAPRDELDFYHCHGKAYVKRLEQSRSIYHRPERPPVRSQRGHRRGNGRECRRPHGFIRKLGNTFGDPVRYGWKQMFYKWAVYEAENIRLDRSSGRFCQLYRYLLCIVPYGDLFSA